MAYEIIKLTTTLLLLRKSAVDVDNEVLAALIPAV